MAEVRSPSSSDLVTAATVEAFVRDGAAVVRNVIDEQWIERMRGAIDTVRTDPGLIVSTSRGFYNGFFASRCNRSFGDFIRDSPLPELAAALLRATSVTFFYDQLIIKEPGLAEATPWHLDSTYFPTVGGRILSIWVPFDSATPTSGAVTYLRGSHNQVRQYGPDWAKATIATLAEPGHDTDRAEFITWTLEPGDVLIHDVDMIHAAPRAMTGRRRALATRWMDQDVRYRPDDHDFFHLSRAAGLAMPTVPLAPGDPMPCSLFPLVWPR